LQAEGEALRKAALANDEPDFMMHDQQVHGLILDFAGNHYARKVIDNIRDATRLVGASTFQSFRTLVEVYDEHLPIIEAIAARDPAAAGSAMYQHLRQTGALLLRKSIGVDSPGVEAESERLWTEFVDVSPAPSQVRSQPAPAVGRVRLRSRVAECVHSGLVCPSLTMPGGSCQVGLRVGDLDVVELL